MQPWALDLQSDELPTVLYSPDRVLPKKLTTSDMADITSINPWTTILNHHLLNPVAFSVDPEEMHYAVSHLGLHCLLRLACLNTNGKYSISA